MNANALTTRPDVSPSPGGEGRVEGEPQTKNDMSKNTSETDPQAPGSEAATETPAPAPAPSKGQTFEEKHADAITRKVNAGLSREQAIEVLKHQHAEDSKRRKKN